MSDIGEGSDIDDPRSLDDKPQAQAPPPTPDRPAADKAPKKKGPGRPKGSKNKTAGKTAGDPARPPTESAEAKKLAKQLDGLLKGPAFAFEAIGEEWPANHVDKQGAVLAQEITRYAQKNLVFKARLEAFLEGGETTALIFAGVMYVAPLGIYFGAIPAPERVRVLLAIPERKPALQGPGGPVPEEMRAQLENEARERGFLDAFGEPDIDAYMAKVSEAANAVRKDG